MPKTTAYLVYDHRPPDRTSPYSLCYAKYSICGRSVWIGGITWPEITPETVAAFVRRNTGAQCSAADVEIIDSRAKMLAAGWTPESYAYVWCGNRRAELPFKD